MSDKIGMLVLERDENECIDIRDHHNDLIVRFVILRQKGTKTRVGVIASPDVSVERPEALKHRGRAFSDEVVEAQGRMQETAGRLPRS